MVPERASPSAMAVAVGVALTALAVAGQGPMTNNFDFARVLASVPVEAPQFAVLPACLPWREGAALAWPDSPLAALAWPLAWGARALGAPCFPIDALAGLLSALFWSGVAAALRGMPRRHGWWLLGAAALHYLVLAPLLWSFYEESALVALAPWLALLRAATWRQAGLAALGMLAAVTVKTQAVFLAPLLVHMVAAPPRPSRAGWLLVLGALALAAPQALGRRAEVHNDFHRIFNGLGWSALEVADWPAREFDGRLAHFLEHLDGHAPPLLAHCDPLGLGLTGASMWPRGQAILDGEDPSGAAGQAWIRSLGPRDFLACLRGLGDPGAVPRNLARVWLGSDYTLDYLILPSGRPLEAPFRALRDLLAGHGVWAFLGVAALTLAAAGAGAAPALAYVVLLSPAFVLAGDGYYEWEKHMALQLALVLPVALHEVRRRAPRPPVRPDPPPPAPPRSSPPP